MDGGMGQELRRRGLKGPNTLWSSYALIADPAAVEAVHLDYIEAGARLIVTNSYSTTRRRLRDGGVEDRFAELNRLAGEVACRARDESGETVLIAASLPPLGITYQPGDVAPAEEAVPLYAEQAAVLAPYVDLFLCETLSSGAEGRAAAEGAATTGKPVWVAWTLEDTNSGRLRSGETIGEAAALLEGQPVSALLANCCPPESVTAGLPALAALGDRPFGGYANGFVPIPEGWDLRVHGDTPGRRDDLDPEAYAAHVARWIAAGARLVGGCCEVGPAHIARLRALIG
ncbi:MAG: homocysteine S-methyltransferase family protein [Inquilinus sp.]|nr:homocysteine S-methyltransferase family protein [Inquilinus sp.]